MQQCMWAFFESVPFWIGLSVRLVGVGKSSGPSVRLRCLEMGEPRDRQLVKGWRVQPFSRRQVLGVWRPTLVRRGAGSNS